MTDGMATVDGRFNTNMLSGRSLIGVPCFVIARSETTKQSHQRDRHPAGHSSSDSDPGFRLDSRVRGNDDGRDAHLTEECFALALRNGTVAPRNSLD